MGTNSQATESLLASAREGESKSLDQLLDIYRNYLRLLARTQIAMRLRVKIDPSDLVQETLLEAYQGFGQFRGRNSHELMAWLRQILVRNVADRFRNQLSRKRDLNREKSLEMEIDRSSQDLAQSLCDPVSSPSEQVSRHEQIVLLADVLGRLPTDYHEVIMLRHIEHLSFDEIAERMDRTSGAVRMLFSRAIDQLRKEMEAQQ